MDAGVAYADAVAPLLLRQQPPETVEEQLEPAEEPPAGAVAPPNAVVRDDDVYGARDGGNGDAQEPRGGSVWG